MKHFFSFFLIVVVISCKDKNISMPIVPTVKHVGAMKNVMKKGELQGTIALDTLDKNHLYAIGPLEYLQGEITVFDGISYISNVETDTSMMVSETLLVKAPFLVYTNIKKWEEIKIPNSINDLKSLEWFWNNLENKSDEPFAFKIEAQIKEANIHIVNLPKGVKVSSPEEAHQGQVNYILKDKAVDLIGFYSTKHHAVFTHHDTNMHIHLITKDRKLMGHLESLVFKSGTIKAFLQK